MKMLKRLIDCLDENKISYEVLRHPEAVTAQRIAQAEHVKGRRHAKVVMVKSGAQHLMIVLPAEHLIDLGKLAKIVGKEVSLESEEEFEVFGHLQYSPSRSSGPRASRPASSGPRASCALMSALEARGPGEHERAWRPAVR